MAGGKKSLWRKKTVQEFDLHRQANCHLKKEMTAISKLMMQWCIVLVRKDISRLTCNIGTRRQRHKLAMNNFR